MTEMAHADRYLVDNRAGWRLAVTRTRAHREGPRPAAGARPVLIILATG
jgi:hypothetical protein